MPAIVAAQCGRVLSAEMQMRFDDSRIDRPQTRIASAEALCDATGT
jgi:hypothetical protein